MRIPARTRRARRMVGGTLAAGGILGVVAGVLLSLPHPLDTKTTCLYTGGGISALAGFDRLTGQQVNCVLLYSDGNTTWSEWAKPWFTEPAAGDSDWRGWLRADPSARRVVLSQEMVPDNVPANWRELGAAGAYDGYARQLAANLVAAGMGNAVIRLGHEMNGTWYHDSLGNDSAEYGDWSAYWARIVKAMRPVSGAHFLFDWNVNAGYRDIPLDQLLPGRQRGGCDRGRCVRLWYAGQSPRSRRTLVEPVPRAGRAGGASSRSPASMANRSASPSGGW